MASKRYPKMDRSNRAKQFMPFDALKGFREALAEKEREQMLVTKKELSEEQMTKLDCRLRQINKGDDVAAEYFQDGEYVQIAGIVTGINENSRILEIKDTQISFDDICELEFRLFFTE